MDPRVDPPHPANTAGGIFAPGDLVSDRYRIRRFIAAGGVADVYEAEELELGGGVALKALRPAGPHDERARERFKREIQLARRVTHRNVCRIFEAGVHPRPGRLPVPYLTMELLSGETLHERLERRGPMALEEVIRFARQMAAALSAAHEVGVIHRDFKSSNVMLVDDATEIGGERAVVTDFGLARAIAAEDGSGYATTSDGFSGTPVYMAPEQATGGEITPRTDVYALGVVLFEMLTGDVPFRGSSPMATVVKRLQEEAPSPRELVPDLDRRAEAAVLRCLAREPEDRFASAEEVIEALETGPVSGRWRRRASSRRRPALIGATAALVGLLVVGLWVGSRPRSSGRVAAGTPVQLTSSPAVATDPAFSADGRRIAFASERDGRSQILLKEVAPGAPEVRLTETTSDGLQPAFSPDGRYLAFYSRSRGGIWQVDLEEGGEPRQITRFGSRPAYSPDGRWIVFQEHERVDLAERSLPALPPSTLWLVSTSGGEPRRLTSVGVPSGGHGEPSWSPAGDRIAFSASDRRSSALWSIERDGGDLQLLSDRGWVNVHPVWAVDGRSVYYIGLAEEGDQASAYSVWQLPVDEDGKPGGAPRLVSALGLATIRQIALAPDGDRMVYSAVETRSNLHWLPLRPDGSAGASKPLTEGRNRTSRPSFSPDGQLIAFDRWYIGVNLDVWLLDLAEDAGPRQITDNPGWDSQASWFPDGKRIAYLSERDGTRALWSRDLDSGASALLADLGEEADWARLSPGGRRVAFHSRAGGSTLNLWTLDLATEQRQQLTFDSELMGFPVWSPDGSLLAFDARRGNDGHLMVMPAAGGTPHQLTFAAGESWPYGFSSDGSKIAFAGLRDGIWNIYWIATEGGEEHRLTDNVARDAYLRYPAWSPRGDGIAYELSETTGDVWLLQLKATD